MSDKKDNEQRIVYKVVKQEQSGHLVSFYVRSPLQVKYPVNKWIYNKNPLLVFDTLKNARAFIAQCNQKHDKSVQVWECVGKNVFPAPYISHYFWGWDTESMVNDFWNKYLITDLTQALQINVPLLKVTYKKERKWVTDIATEGFPRTIYKAPPGTLGTQSLILVKRVDKRRKHDRIGVK